MINKSDGRFGFKFGTRAVQGCTDRTVEPRAVSYPIYQTSTYINPGLGENIDFSYTRCGNPTRETLQDTAALLEDGAAAFAFSSGLAAENALFSLFEKGAHILIGDDIYGGTYRQTVDYWSRFGMDFEFVNTCDLTAVERAVRPNTRMLFMETPTNPMMKVSDIAALASITKSKGILFAVDNTFLTPYFQKPLNLGADIVVHSATKYLAGHNDTMAGLVIVKDETLAPRLDFMIRTLGAGLSPFDCWLTLRGIKTLALRMEKHQNNALTIAQFLQNHPKIDKVYYVGLSSHPSYELSKRQATGFGGMISFTLKNAADVAKVLSGGSFIAFAESLGGVETLITYPKTQTHATVPKEVCERIGITEKLVRLSVGIEEPEDIIADLTVMLS